MHVWWGGTTTSLCWIPVTCIHRSFVMSLAMRIHRSTLHNGPPCPHEVTTLNLQPVRRPLYDHTTVHRKAFLIAVLACLVGLVIAYPAIEFVDHWDAPGPTSDSELQYIGVLTVVGSVALFAQLTVIALLLLAYVPTGLQLLFRENKQAFAFFSRLTASPPSLPLRI